MDSLNNTIINVLAFLTAARLVFMPVIFIINKAIEQSESKEDDIQWGKIKSSWWFILIQTTLDYIVGLQVAPPKKEG